MSADRSPAVVGVGASAGGIEALFDLVGGLPDGFPATMLVVLHQSPTAPTVLPTLLDRRCALPVGHARDAEPVGAGRVLVAPPDHHLLVRDGHVAVTRGPRENGHRPAVDPLFRSIALEAGPSGIGVVLSGMLDDGAAGLLGIVRHGGTALVQDPREALFPGMPEAALRQVPGAVVGPAGELAAVLTELVRQPGHGQRGTDDRLAYEVAVALGDADAAGGTGPPGSPAGLTCPDCSGPLFDLGDDRLLHFRCRVGHAWSEENLRDEQDVRTENALYLALRTLEEKAALQHRIAASADERGSARLAARARDSAHETLRSAAVLRSLLTTPRNGEVS